MKKKVGFWVSSGEESVMGCLPYPLIVTGDDYTALAIAAIQEGRGLLPLGRIKVVAQGSAVYVRDYKEQPWELVDSTFKSPSERDAAVRRVKEYRKESGGPYRFIGVCYDPTTMPMEMEEVWEAGDRGWTLTNNKDL